MSKVCSCKFDFKKLNKDDYDLEDFKNMKSDIFECSFRTVQWVIKEFFLDIKPDQMSESKLGLFLD